MLLYLLFLSGFIGLFNTIEYRLDGYCKKNEAVGFVKKIKKETDILTVKYRIVNFVKSALLGILCVPTCYLFNSVLFYPDTVNYYQVSVFAGALVNLARAILPVVILAASKLGTSAASSAILALSTVPVNLVAATVSIESDFILLIAMV